MEEARAAQAVEQARSKLGLASSVPARAWAVRRLDRPGVRYHLVVFGDEGACVGVATVQQDGAVGNWAHLPGTGSHTVLDEAQAQAAAGLGPGAAAELVFVPSRVTRSPFAPVWQLTAGDRVRYVDQQGRAWDELGEAGPGG